MRRQRPGVREEGVCKCSGMTAPSNKIWVYPTWCRGIFSSLKCTERTQVGWQDMQLKKPLPISVSELSPAAGTQSSPSLSLCHHDKLLLHSHGHHLHITSTITSTSSPPSHLPHVYNHLHITSNITSTSPPPSPPSPHHSLQHLPPNHHLHLIFCLLTISSNIYHPPSISTTLTSSILSPPSPPPPESYHLHHHPHFLHFYLLHPLTFAPQTLHSLVSPTSHCRAAGCRSCGRSFLGASGSPLSSPWRHFGAADS